VKNYLIRTAQPDFKPSPNAVSHGLRFTKIY
jgi:hypothetical protein